MRTSVWECRAKAEHCRGSSRGPPRPRADPVARWRSRRARREGSARGRRGDRSADGGRPRARSTVALSHVRSRRPPPPQLRTPWAQRTCGSPTRITHLAFLPSGSCWHRRRPAERSRCGISIPQVEVGTSEPTSRSERQTPASAGPVYVPVVRASQYRLGDFRSGEIFSSRIFAIRWRAWARSSKCQAVRLSGSL